MWKQIAKNIIHMNYDISFVGRGGLNKFNSKTQLQQKLLWKSLYYTLRGTAKKLGLLLDENGVWPDCVDLKHGHKPGFLWLVLCSFHW